MIMNYEKAARMCSLYFKLTSGIGFIVLTYAFFEFTWLHEIHGDGTSVFTYMAYVLGCGAVSAIAKLYVILLWIIRARFIYINSLMKRRFLYTNFTTNISMTKSDSIAFVKNMARLYDKLIQNMDNINHCYSFQVWTICVKLSVLGNALKITFSFVLFHLKMMINIGSAFSYCVLTLYACYRKFISNETNQAIIDSIPFNATWSFYYMAYILTTVHLSNTLTNEVSQIHFFITLKLKYSFL